MGQLRVRRFFLCAVVASVPYAPASAVGGQAAEELEQEAASGADASNPTAAVNFQDVRYRYFDLNGRGDKHSFETEGAFVLHPRFKLTNELRGVITDRTGSTEGDLEEIC